MAQLKSTVVNGTLEVQNDFLGHGNLKVGTEDDTSIELRTLEVENAAGSIYLSSENISNGARALKAGAHGSSVYDTAIISVNTNNFIYSYANWFWARAAQQEQMTLNINCNLLGGASIQWRSAAGTQILGSTSTSTYQTFAGPSSNLSVGRIYFWAPRVRRIYSTAGDSSTLSETINYSSYFAFYEASPNSTYTGITNYNEIYQLPTATAGLTGNRTYSILTTKKIITVAQGGTGRATGGTTYYVRVGGGIIAADQYYQTFRVNSVSAQVWPESGKTTPILEFHYNSATAATSRIDEKADSLRIIFP